MKYVCAFLLCIGGVSYIEESSRTAGFSDRRYDCSTRSILLHAAVGHSWPKYLTMNGTNAHILMAFVATQTCVTELEPVVLFE